MPQRIPATILASHPKPKLRRPAASALPLAFLTGAAKLSGKTLAVAITLYDLACAARRPTVVLSSWALRRFSISPDAAFDALTRMSEAGLIRADRRRGRHAEVTLLDDAARELATAGRESSGRDHS